MPPSNASSGAVEAAPRRTGTADADREVLALRDVSKRFGVTQALAGVGFGVRRGHIHGLLGGNGSGKSTLIKTLAGVYSADEGTLEIGGSRHDLRTLTPALGRRLGLRFVHQNPAVFRELTVAENLAIGRAGGFPSRAGGIRWRELHADAAAALARYEIEGTPRTPLGDLRPADQTMVAIARALQDDIEGPGDVLVLDEPTASLPEHEVQVLMQALRRCASDGITILYVSHRLDEVLSLVDDVTVLRDGRHVVTRSAEGLTRDALVETIVGRAIAPRTATTTSMRADTPAVRVAGLRGGPLKDVSLDVWPGEIVGIGGLLGSGRTELLRMLFGAFPVEAGTIELAGRPVAPATPAEAMRLGVAYVPENRGVDAVFPDLGVATNLSVARLREYRRHLTIRRSRERSDAQAVVRDLAIRTAGTDAPLSALSGGNQQKVIVGRWLGRKPSVLLLDEPTQGVDVGARADLYAAVRAAVREGMAVVLVTSDLEELAHEADRVLVLDDGRIRAEVAKADLDAHELNQLLHGGIA